MLNSAPAFFPLDPLYLNERRVAALTGAEVFIGSMGSAIGFEKRNEHIRILRTAEVLREWIGVQKEGIMSVQAAWLTGRIRSNQLVTFEGTLWSKNARGNRRKESSVAYARLSELGPERTDMTIEFALHPDHVVVGSAGDRLKGKLADMFVLAQVSEIAQDVIHAIPVFIGYLGEYKFMGKFFHAGRNEVFLEDIDSFRAIRKTSKIKHQELELLREVPEQEIKMAFAEIIEEETVPKDWGGENSDLYSTNVELGGRRISTAFLFKGPAGGRKFREMQISDLGKNGDQIERLCNEPADLLIVQHCHLIGTGVRKTLRAFCNQVHRQRRYALFTGLDTLRLLRAYKKCGFGG